MKLSNPQRKVLEALSKGRSLRPLYRGVSLQYTMDGKKPLCREVTVISLLSLKMIKPVGDMRFKITEEGISALKEG